jgi:hypothetical protein
MIIYFISRLLYVSDLLLGHRQENLTQFRETSFLQRIRCHYFKCYYILFKIRKELKELPHVLKCTS